MIIGLNTIPFLVFYIYIFFFFEARPYIDCVGFMCVNVSVRVCECIFYIISKTLTILTYPFIPITRIHQMKTDVIVAINKLEVIQHIINN